MEIRSARAHPLQTAAFERGGPGIIAPIHAPVTGSTDTIAAVPRVAVTAAIVSPLHNHPLDLAEGRLTGHVASERPARMRPVHAVRREGSSSVATLPVSMLLGGHGFRVVLAIDVAMTVFFGVGLSRFHILRDRWRPVRATGAATVPASAGPVTRAERAPLDTG